MNHSDQPALQRVRSPLCDSADGRSATMISQIYNSHTHTARKVYVSLFFHNLSKQISNFAETNRRTHTTLKESYLELEKWFNAPRFLPKPKMVTRALSDLIKRLIYSQLAHLVYGRSLRSENTAFSILLCVRISFRARASLTFLDVWQRSELHVSEVCSFLNGKQTKNHAGVEVDDETFVMKVGCWMYTGHRQRTKTRHST